MLQGHVPPGRRFTDPVITTPKPKIDVPLKQSGDYCLTTGLRNVVTTSPVLTQEVFAPVTGPSPSRPRRRDGYTGPGPPPKCTSWVSLNPSTPSCLWEVDRVSVTTEDRDLPTGRDGVGSEHERKGR